VSYPLLILGGGLSGLAAGIRFARFGKKVLILEKHSKLGGLNSYYQKQGHLFETGLHTVTNYAAPNDRRAPLNRLLRQLKIPRSRIETREQIASEVFFAEHGSLVFTNDFSHFKDEIAQHFPDCIDKFLSLVSDIDAFDPFTPRPFISARSRLVKSLDNELLVDFLLCPLMFYGSSLENDLDFSQFVILFRSIFQEGFFRPAGTMKDFLLLLRDHYHSFGGELRLNAPVVRILTNISTNAKKVIGVQLANGEEIFCDNLLSTIGWPETISLLDSLDETTPNPIDLAGRLSFMETIYILPQEARKQITTDRTIIFYNLAERFNYRRPDEAIDFTSGVICFPENFQGVPLQKTFQLRTTHLANYEKWRDVQATSNDHYKQLKAQSVDISKNTVGKIIGNFQQNIVYEDSFTPLTIERYTSRIQGAVYGCPQKRKDGRSDFNNMFLAGTDQGFLGIVGSMLSGTSMVNQHLLIDA
jgi:phytoene dehydrogenase-like protein